MINVILKQSYNDITLEYNTLGEVEELVRVVGSGQPLADMTITIRLEKPEEKEEGKE